MRAAPALARALADLGRRASARGTRAAVVGGCVRDALLGRTVRDIDALAEGDAAGLADECALAWGARLEYFGRFGTARLSLPGGERLDLATARAEDYPAPAALPVVRPASIEGDLKRRDFSVNAMARLLGAGGLGELYDPLGGRMDLKARRLRALHPESFRDDPTRLFRAARYAGRLGLRLEPATARRLRESVRRKDPALLSRERIRQELWRILEEEDPGPALRLCARWGLTPFFHPRFKAPGGLAKAPDALTRLGLIAFGMGKDGNGLLASLPLAHGDSAALSAALKAAKTAATPAQALPEAATRILRLALPRLPKAALGPRLVTGTELLAVGLTPGPVFAKLLCEAASLQWKGALRTKAQARAWLTRALAL
ncbi:MAG: CCA tRNA nucleotidyltransferase [Elusimicrobia bacterium]|nr:CCA tRNA nucleotidyltransferase [Elusimicrobiota bacterium]